MTNDALSARRDLSDVRVNLIQHSSEIEEFRRWLSERRPGSVLAFDLETSGLSPYARGARIRLAQVGDGQTGWAIPWDLWKGLALETLTEYEGPLVGHNSTFDIKWLEHFSDWRAPWARVHDTMIAARIHDPISSASLKYLSDRYIDKRASYGQKMLDEAFVKHGWTWDTVPIEFEPFWSYGALDTVLTARLHEMYQKRTAPGGPDAEAYDLEMNTLRIVTRMEQRGIRVDLDYAREMYDKCDDYAERILAWGKETFGIRLSSIDQLGQKFIDLGAEILETTATGKPKVDKYQLQIFADPDNDYPMDVRILAGQVLAMRKHQKLASAYFRNVLETAVPSSDGDIVHASINPLAARTGRMSVSAPALQQLPRGDAMVRNMFVARNGNRIIATDFSQIEMRMMAVFSEDPELQHAFQDADESGGDFFVNIGREVYRDPEFDKKDKRRGLIKGTMYGLCYGAGPAKMAVTAGVPVDRMKHTVDALTTRYPGIKNFMRSVEDVGKRREMHDGQGWIEGIDGRRFPCDTGKVYTLVNYCLAPDTPILRSDLTHVPAAKIQMGDRLVAFDEETQPNTELTARGRAYYQRRWRTAVVEAVTEVVKPTMRLTLSDGRTVECSDDHLWLARHTTQTQPRTRWVPTKKLVVGQLLHSIGMPWEVSESRDGGWLAGLYDGEGYLGTRPMGKQSTALLFSQCLGTVMDRFQTVMHDLDLPYRYASPSPSSTSLTASCYTTAVPQIMRILGVLQPERFKPLFESVYEGGALTGGAVDYVAVERIEYIGKRSLISIQTSTRTLIANGILSHNCIQGGAAVAFKRALSRLDAAGYGDYFLLPVHDEILVDIPEEQVAEALSDIPKIMQDDSMAVSIPADAEGPYERWGEKYL